MKYYYRGKIGGDSYDIDFNYKPKKKKNDNDKEDFIKESEMKIE